MNLDWMQWQDWVNHDKLKNNLNWFLKYGDFGDKIWNWLVKTSCESLKISMWNEKMVKND
jgi:hypothetical protein